MIERGCSIIAAVEFQERNEHPPEVHRVEINLLLAGIFFFLKFVIEIV